MILKATLLHIMLIIFMSNYSNALESYCSPSYCNKRGICRLNSQFEPVCKCFDSYYKGPRCIQMVNTCDTVPCVATNTKNCFSYVGNSFCDCKPYFIGRLCEFNIKRNIRHATYGAIYAYLEPRVDQILPIFILHKFIKNATNIVAIFERSYMILKPSDFSIRDTSWMGKAVRSSMSSFIYDDPLPHYNYYIVNYFFLHQGKTNLIFRSKVNVDSTEYFADWTFPFYVKSATNCTIDIRFQNGVASISPVWYTKLVRNKLYKFGTSLSNLCNETNNVSVIFKYTIAGPNFFDKINLLDVCPDENTISNVFNVSDLSQIPSNEYRAIYAFCITTSETSPEGEVGNGRELGYVEYSKSQYPIIGITGGEVLLFSLDDDIVLSSFFILLDDIHENYTNITSIDEDRYATYNWSTVPLDPKLLPDTESVVSAGTISTIVNTIVDKITSTGEYLYSFIPSLSDLIPGMPHLSSFIPGWDSLSSITNIFKLPTMPSIYDFMPSMHIGDYIPSISDYIPSVSDYIPSVSDYIPSVSDYIPSVSDYIPSVSDYIPSAVSDYIPSVSDYVPSVSDYIPSVGDYIPSVSDYVPSVSDYVPSVSDYVPSVSDYVPSVSDYVPSVSDYVPSVGDYIPFFGGTSGSSSDTESVTDEDSDSSYLGSFFGRRRKIKPRFLLDWFLPAKVTQLGNDPILVLQNQDIEENRAIYLQICIVGISYDDKKCSYKSILLFIKEKWIEPVLEMYCIKNCGESGLNSMIEADAAEISYFKLGCRLRCPVDIDLAWTLYGSVKKVIYTINTDSDIIEPLPIVHFMITPGTVPLSFDYAVVIAKEKTRRLAMAKYYYKYFTKPDIAVHFNFTCPIPLPQKVVAIEEDFYMCITNADVESPLSYLYFQHVAEIDFDIGFLFAYGQLPYVKKALLAPSGGGIYYTTRNDFHGAEYLTTYSSNFKVSYPPLPRGEKTYIHLSEKLFEGYEEKPSVQFNIIRNEWFEVAQKMHFIVIQFAQMPLLDHITPEETMKKIKLDILKRFLDDLHPNLKLDIAPEILQMTCLMYEMVFINTLPVNQHIGTQISKILHVINLNFKQIIISDWTVREKPNRLLGIVRPMKACIAALFLSQVLVPAESLSITSQIKNINTQTRYEIEPDEEQSLTKAPDYSDSWNLFKLEEKENLEKRSHLLLESLSLLADIVCRALEPVGLDEDIYWPAIRMSKNGGIGNMVSFAKWASSSYFQEPKVVPGDAKKVLITFPTKENDSQYCINVDVIDSVPFWWDASAKHLLPFTAIINVLKDYQPFTLDANFLHPNLNLQKNYESAVARRYTSPLDMESATFHYIVLKDPNMPNTIIINFKQITTDLVIMIKKGKRPKLKDFRDVSNTYEIGETSRKYSISYTLKKWKTNSLLYIGVQPKTSDSPVNYKINMMAFACKMLVEARYSTSVCRNVTAQKETALSCTCAVQESESIFGVGYMALKYGLVGMMPVLFKFEIMNCYIIAVTVAVALFLTCFLYLIAFKLDLDDNETQHAAFLLDNRKNDRYVYVVIVVTGSKPNSETSANVGIKIYGSIDNTERHILRGFSPKHIWKKRSVKWFTLTHSKSLGKIRAVEMWMDQRGTRTHWFCDKVIIRDYYIKVEWVFMVKKWFSLYYGEKTLHRVLYQTKKREPKTIFEKVFSVEDYPIHHIWFGMFTREYCHTFVRTIKVLSCTSIIFSIMFVNFLLIGVVDFDEENIADEGYFNDKVLFPKAIASLIIALIINYPIIIMLKLSSPFNNAKLVYYEFAGVDPKVPIHSYVYSNRVRIALRCFMLLLIIIFVSILYFYGTTYGTRKSQMWLVSTMFAIIFDVLFAEMLYVIIRAVVWRVILKKHDFQRFCNENIDLQNSVEERLACFQSKNYLLTKDMYKPLGKFYIEIYKEKEKYFMRYKKVIFDGVIYVIYALLLSIVFIYIQKSYASYSTKVLEKIFIYANYTKTMTLNDVNGLTNFYVYLNSTIVPSMHWRDPFWFIMATYQLNGVARLRQFRVADDNYCPVPLELGQLLRDVYCIPDFNFEIMDINDYNPNWLPFNKRILMLQAFLYKKTHYSFYPFYGEHGQVPSDGGYISNLGTSATNTHVILNVLKKFNWIDNRTQIIVLELSSFNSDANIMSLIRMVFDRSKTGDWIKSYEIYSFPFLYSEGMKVLTLLMLIIFFSNIVITLLHQMNYIFSHGFRAYTQSFWNIVDLSIAILSIMITVISYNAFSTMQEFLNLRDISGKNTYFNIMPLVVCHYFLKVFASLILFLCFFRIIRFFRVHPVMQRVGRAIIYSVVPLAVLLLLYAIVMVMLSIMFWLIYGTAVEQFRSYHGSLMMTLLLPKGLDKQIDWNEMKKAGMPGFCTILVLLVWVKLIFANLIISILVLNFKKAEFGKSPVTLMDYFYERIYPEMKLSTYSDPIYFLNKA